MAQGRTLLICEDKTFEANRYLEYAARLGWRAVAASGASDALSLLGQRAFDAVLADLSLGRGPGALDDGFRVIEAAARLAPRAVVVATSALPDLAVAEHALSLGATHFLRKPILNAEELSIALRLGADRAALRREERARDERARNAGWPYFPDALLVTIERAARHPSLPVIIVGESGTGKETTARAIVAARARIAGDVPVRVAHLCPLPEENGVARIASAFDDADGGALILDEPGRLCASAQETFVSLLAAPRGGDEDRRPEFQILCLTTHEPDVLVAQGRMLPELRALLWGHELRLEPLRERVGDIPALVAGKLSELGIAYPADALGPFCDRLAEHPWQGNVRQLLRAVELVLMVEGAMEDRERPVRLDPANVPFFAPRRAGDPPAQPVQSATPTSEFSDALSLDAPFYTSIEAFERALLLAAIARHGGNLAQVCRALRLPRSTLDLKRKRLDLP